MTKHTSPEKDLMFWYST